MDDRLNFNLESAPPVAPKSAARLAADALFAAPPAPPPAAGAPLVVVLRKRLLAPASAPAETPAPAAAPVPAEERQPRVFRAPNAAVRQLGSAAAEPPAVARPRRSRRIGPDRRAGLIRTIVAAPPPPAEQPISDATLAMAARDLEYTQALAEAARRESEYASLMRELAELQTALAAARRARGFKLTDPHLPA